MIFFLHGDNQVESRNKLSQFISTAKINKKEILRLDGLQINLTDLKQALEAESLFGQEKLIILENLFSRPKSKIKESLIKYLKSEEITQELAIWEKKEILGTILRWLPKNFEIKKYNIPVQIFKFLDSILPNNTYQVLTRLKSCIKINTPEMIFYMLVRQVRLLVIAKDIGNKGLSGAPWYVSKLIKQASNFKLNQLINIYKNLLSIDIKIKTGKTLMPLNWHLEMLLINM